MATKTTTGLSITLSPKSIQNSNNPFLHKGQTVNFINILTNQDAAREKPIKVDYGFSASKMTENGEKTVLAENKIALLNYQEISSTTDTDGFNVGDGFAPAAAGINMDVYKREVAVVGEGDDATFVNLTTLKRVLNTVSAAEFSDYNIENNRMYQYVIYPIEANANTTAKIPVIAIPQSPVDGVLKTNWPAWSITELHPVDNTFKRFRASKDDVWLFNYNVDTGDQSQNTSRTEYQTLGEYPRYAQGALNYIRGQVTCLLGSEVIPAFELIDGDDTAGGYVERRLFTESYSSNKKVDMLKAWRKVVYSSNPKLLKDRKGQSFIVTLTEASNKPQDNVKYQPDTISFTWTQIETTDDVVITSEVTNIDI